MSYLYWRATRCPQANIRYCRYLYENRKNRKTEDMTARSYHISETEILHIVNTVNHSQMFYTNNFYRKNIKIKL